MVYTTELDILNAVAAGGSNTDTLKVSGTVQIPDTKNLSQNITGAGQTVSISTAGMGSIIVQVTGTFSATLVTEATVDGTTWFNLYGVDNSVVQSTNTITASNQLFFNANGVQQFRVRCSSYSSGTASVSIVANQSFGGVISSVSTLAGGSMAVSVANSITGTVNQGSPSALISGSWPVYISDGTTGPVVVKSGNTAAQSGDRSLIVALSPNSPVPTGANSIGQVTANAGTNLNTSLLATSANVTGLQVDQASTTSGQKGGLVQGAVTTNTPSYTTAQTNPISLDTSGLLRVSVKDTPANTNKFLVTADPVTFASAQHVIIDSGALNANQSTNAAQINGVTPLMGNGTTGTGSQRVTIASDNTAFAVNATLQTGANTIGALTANQSVNTAQVAGNTLSTGNGTVGTGVQRVAIASDNTAFSVNATPPTLTKGTQSSTGYSVQQLKDAGRTNVNYWAVAAASGTTGAETAISLTKASGTGSTSSAASFVITSGKTYRITSLVFATRGNVTATAQITTFSLRINTGGAVITSSTPITISARSGAAATSLAYDRMVVNLGGDGYEIAGDGTLQFGVTANSVFSSNAPTWDVLITGYEY